MSYEVSANWAKKSGAEAPLIYRDETFGCGEELHVILLMEYNFITNRG
jgi:hypothetical protein